VHVRGIVVSIAPWHRIAIAAVHDQTALDIGEWGVGGGDQPTGLDPAQPYRRVLGKAPGRLIALAFERQVDVVVVDKHRAETRLACFTLHPTRPPSPL